MAKKNLTDAEYKEYFSNSKKRKNGGGFKNLNKKIQIALVVLAAIVAIFLIFVIAGLPSFEELENPKPPLAAKVYTQDGELLGSLFIENRIETTIDSLPPHLIKALIATEDRKFYDHWGVDLARFAKAMIKNVFLFDREGASTITQQLAKNLYSLKAGQENAFQTTVRKVREWITAVQMERTFTKDEILELYLNVSYFGRSAYGIETAARVYFDKPARKLNVQESALFVALLKSPTNYDPVNKQENAIARRNLVLRNMVDAGYMEQEKYEVLKEEPIKLTTQIQKIHRTIAPHFMEYVRQQLEDLSQEHDFDVYRDGLTVYTSLDYKMQAVANKVSKEHLEEYQKIFNKNFSWNNNKKLLASVISKHIKNAEVYKIAETEEAKAEIFNTLKADERFIDSIKKIESRIEMGFVAIDPKTGYIKAMIGGSNQDFGRGLNHATGIRRQPGSSFKPLVYATALENGSDPNTSVSNERFTYKNWSPQNNSGNYGGYVTLRKGLAFSLNVVSARLTTSELAPPSQVIEVAKKMGIKSKIDNYPSIALGTSEVVPMELISAYGTFANGGVHVQPTGILKIEDKNGKVIYEAKPETEQAISARTAALMTDMMKDVINYGTGAGAKRWFARQAAGKTGTTQNYSDAWFVGFTPNLVAGAWVGFDDHRVKFTSSYGQGARAAMPMWAKFMAEVHRSENIPPEEFSLPEGMNKVTLCDETGLRANSACPSTHSDLLQVVPPECDVHKVETIPEDVGAETPW